MSGGEEGQLRNVRRGVEFGGWFGGKVEKLIPGVSGKVWFGLVVLVVAVWVEECL